MVSDHPSKDSLRGICEGIFKQVFHSDAVAVGECMRITMSSEDHLIRFGNRFSAQSTFLVSTFQHQPVRCGGWRWLCRERVSKKCSRCSLNSFHLTLPQSPEPDEKCGFLDAVGEGSIMLGHRPSPRQPSEWSSGSARGIPTTEGRVLSVEKHLNNPCVHALVSWTAEKVVTVLTQSLA